MHLHPHKLGPDNSLEEVVLTLTHRYLKANSNCICGFQLKRATTTMSISVTEILILMLAAFPDDQLEVASHHTSTCRHATCPVPWSLGVAEQPKHFVLPLVPETAR